MPAVSTNTASTPSQASTALIRHHPAARRAQRIPGGMVGDCAPKGPSIGRTSVDSSSRRADRKTIVTENWFPTVSDLLTW
ncbi:hypothetical protein GCM10010385_55360 [Streptomyces geysiriensis]|nr:hypothetical protein GCM10010385_55360 [Streptomyces geysiriensis]GHC39467.1 hypothetical protein GCM10010308_67880 [Streptomyces vinaceusdrappus]